MKSQALKIQQNIPLAPMTTFKIGGPAKYFVEVSSEDELREAVSYARENKLKIFILGGGSNILVSDEGFEGLVIKLQMNKSELRIDEYMIECGAGLSLMQLVNMSVESNMMGLEWAAGIPGTVGGAIRGNAGAFGGEMADCLFLVKVFDADTMEIREMTLEHCQFEYRYSLFKKNDKLIILSAIISLGKGNKEASNQKIQEILNKRSENLPKNPSAGSFFQNPKVSDPELISRFERQTGQKMKGGRLPAGWLVDEVGLRGKRIGDAAVSQEHANFVVNLGKARAQDVISLFSFIKMRVRDELGVELKEEIQYVGF